MDKKVCSLNVYLNKFDCDIFIVSISISTQPHLHILRSGLRQLSVEPWRVVEGTAGVTATPLPIPQWVGRVDGIRYNIVSITEIIVANE